MEELLYITVRYLVYRNIVDYGFIKFSVFKKIISYVTGVDDVYTIRNIFIKLLDEGFFTKTKNCAMDSNILNQEGPWTKEKFKLWSLNFQ